MQQTKVNRMVFKTRSSYLILLTNKLRQLLIKRRSSRDTPMQRVSKTFNQRGPIKELLPLLRPASSSNPCRFSHLYLSRLLPTGKKSKTSHNIHRLPKTIPNILLSWDSSSRIKTMVKLSPLISSLTLHSLASRANKN